MCAREAGQIEVADIIRRYGPLYRSAHPMPVNRLRAMRAIETCRTADQGGHVDECERCGTKVISYNSCRNRHCPKCQFLKKEQWIEAREEDLLPITYFHVVFTIPDILNPLVLRNQEVFYGLLFKAVSETLTELAANPKRLGAVIGFISILHTWGQNLMDHPHLHTIVPGGGLSLGGRKWKSCKNDFFVHVKVMSKLFRGKFIAYLKKLRAENKLVYPGAVSHLASPEAFNVLIADLYKKNWVVYCKKPFYETKDVLEYLGRYTHRVAISNHRIVKLENDEVFFRWRDYADNNKSKIMPLKADELSGGSCFTFCQIGLLRSGIMVCWGTGAVRRSLLPVAGFLIAYPKRTTTARKPGRKRCSGSPGYMSLMSSLQRRQDADNPNTTARTMQWALIPELNERHERP